jgi:hypothetical protein
MTVRTVSALVCEVVGGNTVFAKDCEVVPNHLVRRLGGYWFHLAELNFLELINRGFHNHGEAEIKAIRNKAIDLLQIGPLNNDDAIVSIVDEVIPAKVDGIKIANDHATHYEAISHSGIHIARHPVTTYTVLDDTVICESYALIQELPLKQAGQFGTMRGVHSIQVHRVFPLQGLYADMLIEPASITTHSYRVSETVPLGCYKSSKIGRIQPLSNCRTNALALFPDQLPHTLHQPALKRLQKPAHLHIVAGVTRLNYSGRRVGLLSEIYFLAFHKSLQL